MPQITPEDIDIDSSLGMQITYGHDIRSYKYVNPSQDPGVEYGIVGYSEGNVNYFKNLFGTSDDKPSSFNYYNFVIQNFISPRVQHIDLTEATHNYYLQFSYNYYMQSYESIASQAHESHLPNHYVIKHNNTMEAPYAAINYAYGDDINEEAAFSLATAGSSINSFLYSMNASADLYLDLGGTNFAYSPTNYYNIYASNFETYKDSEDYDDFKDKTRNCFLSFPRARQSSNAPMYTKMRVNYKKAVSADPTSAGANATFRQAITKSRPYIYYFYHHLNSATPVEKRLNSIVRSYQVSSAFNEYGYNPLQVSEDQVTTPLRIYPALNDEVYSTAESAFLGFAEMPLFGKMDYPPAVAAYHDSYHFLNSLFPNIEAASPSIKQLFEKVDWGVTKQGLGKFIEGNPTYVPNIVCFKIEKYSGTSTIPVQTFYIDHDWADSTNLSYSFFEFLDTQMIYGSKYTYKVYAVCRIATPIVQVIDAYYMDSGGKLKKFYANSVEVDESVGAQAIAPWAEYATQLDLSQETMRNKIYIKTKTETKAEFLEIEIFEDSIDAIEPIFNEPETEFYNQDGKQNDVIIRAELNYNHVARPYIPITPEDEANIEPYLQYFNTNGTYDFQTLNGQGRFEVRRLSSPPEKYTDFANGFSKIFTHSGRLNIQNAISAFTIDKIIPNKKYYYILRTINNHGVFSNPTSVFQLELFQDSDDTYIIVEEYQFKNNLTNNYSKSGKRYFQLKVSNLQGLINEQTTEFAEATTAEEVRNVQLGPGNLRNNLWGKTFKIRLTSEKTGKKIDFNVSFKHTKHTEQPN